MQGIHLEKIVVNAGIGKLAIGTAGFEEKLLPYLLKEIALITGQKPSIRAAKKSIAGFKVREGNTVGLKVTLRGKRMIQFLERFNKIVLPRLRDFKGIDLNNIDQRGNLSIGLKDQAVFPEVNQETVKINFGLQITIVIVNAKNTQSAIDFYRKMGVPLKKSK